LNKQEGQGAPTKNILKKTKVQYKRDELGARGSHQGTKKGKKRKIEYTRALLFSPAEGCPWRIHASTIFYKKTVQVHFFSDF